MKINDKHLAYFASSGIKSDLEGWLWKKGELNTSYQKRWCILTGNLFFYFEKKNDKEPIGVIVLENSFVQLAEGGDSPFTFSIHFTCEGKSRVYKLTADDEVSCTKWVRKLSNSSYRYLAILVDGLEREVKELKATKTLKIQKSEEGDANKQVNLELLESNHEVKSRSVSLVKSCSLPDILDSCNHYHEIQDELFDFDIFPKKEKARKKLSKAKSSGDLSTTSSRRYVSQGKKNLRHNENYSKKLSPRIAKKKAASSRTKEKQKSSIAHSSASVKSCYATISTAEGVTFSELHERHRKEIASFILT